MKTTLLLLAVLAIVVVASTDNSQYSIDPDTPKSAKQVTRRKDGRKLDLVMSDEFNTDGRGFAPGEDDVFEAINQPDNVNQAMEFYNSSTEYVTTKDGNLILYTRAVKTNWIGWCPEAGFPIVYTKNYTSAMIQTWNKFCFTGGVLELSIKLPGGAYSGGLWPAAWLMGNLARATYQRSTLGIWPWSYDTCDNKEFKKEELAFIQEINACDPDPGYGMNAFQGRGAPEIDLFEVMPGHEMPGSDVPIRPFISQSLQISPGISRALSRPKNGEKLDRSDTVWYDDVTMSDEGAFNDGFWGQEAGGVYNPATGYVGNYMEDAISVDTYLDVTHFEQHHVYRLEWQPGVDGYLSWYIDDQFYMNIGGKSVNDLTGAMIPQEPMYLILNTAISHQWGMPEPCDTPPNQHCAACWICYDCTNPDCQCSLPNGMKNCKNMPAKMEIDFMRLYQDPEDSTHTLGCSPKGFPTAEFIKAHSDRYKSWEPYTGLIPVHCGIFQLSALAAFTLLAIGSLWTLGMRIYRHYHDDESHDGSGGVQIGMTTNIGNNPGYVAVSTMPIPTYQTSLQPHDSLNGQHAEEEEVKIELNAEVGSREKRNRNKRGNSVVVPSSYQNLRSSKHVQHVSSPHCMDENGDVDSGEGVNYGSTHAINARTHNTPSSISDHDQEKSSFSSLWFLPSLRKIAMDKLNGLLSRTTGMESKYSKISSSTYNAPSSHDVNMTTAGDSDGIVTRKGSLGDRVRGTLSVEPSSRVVGL